MNPAAPGFPRNGFTHALESVGAWLLGLLWILPLVYAVWTAFHPPEFSTRFVLGAPLTLRNFVDAWHAAPFARYFWNTFVLVTMILAAQLVLGTLAAYAFARFEFRGRDLLFFLVLLQLMVMPDVLIVENYSTMNASCCATRSRDRAAYFASVRLLLLRQTFRLCRRSSTRLRAGGAGPLQVCGRCSAARASDLPGVRAGAVSYHWKTSCGR